MTLTEGDALLRVLETQENSLANAEALKYFEELRSHVNGSRYCMSSLLANTAKGDQARFVFFQVLTYQASNRYETTGIEEQNLWREFLLKWLVRDPIDGMEAVFLRNKAAQLMAIVFLIDYLDRWPTMIADFLNIVRDGGNIRATDIFLRFLKAVDAEIGHRASPASTSVIPQGCNKDVSAVIGRRNSALRDAMRARCVPNLVDFWYYILTSNTSPPHLKTSVYELIGTYVAWIEVTLIANQRFVQILVTHLSDHEVREAAAECITEIVFKKMLPQAKVELVMDFLRVLEPTGVLDPRAADDESEFLCSLAKLVNGFGSQLCALYPQSKKSQTDTDPSNASTSPQLFFATVDPLSPLIRLAIPFLASDYDDVSAAVMEFIREYLSHLKTKKNSLSAEEYGLLQQILSSILQKMKYDKTHNFENPGEDEAIFMEFRSQLKVVFDSVASVSSDLVVQEVDQRLRAVVSGWNSIEFEETEVALNLLYLLGEALPGANHFKGPRSNHFQAWMSSIFSSDILLHPHPAVSAVLLEICVRYDKFFSLHPTHIPAVLQLFLGDRGLRHPSKRNRSRAAYLFIRLITSCRGYLASCPGAEVLASLEELLVSGVNNQLVSSDDLVFLYEAAAVLILSVQTDVDTRRRLLLSLVHPLLQQIHSTPRESPWVPLAMACLTRTSKAFTAQVSMVSLNFETVYVDALVGFVNLLQAPSCPPEVQDAARQYLHRCLVCISEPALSPHLEPALNAFLKAAEDVRSLTDFLPLLNQVLLKYKKSSTAIILQMLPATTLRVSALLASPDEDEREKLGLQKGFLTFLSSLVGTNPEVLLAMAPVEAQGLLMGLMSYASGAADPSCQKLAFSALKKLAALPDNPLSQVLLQEALPAAFTAPLHPAFDLADAQYCQVVGEIAGLLQTMHSTNSAEFLSRLSFLAVNSASGNFPSTIGPIPQVMWEDLAQALAQMDHRTFKKYLTEFYHRLRDPSR